MEKFRLRSLPATSDTVGVHFEVSFQSNFSVTSPFSPVISERLSAHRVPIMEKAAKAYIDNFFISIMLILNLNLKAKTSVFNVKQFLAILVQNISD